MKRSYFYLSIFFFLTIWSVNQCRNATVYRSDFDSDVGFAKTDLSTIAVAEGLAAIQHLEEGRLRVFLSSPNIDIQLNFSGSSAANWQIEVFNAMQNSSVAVTASDNSTLANTALQQSLPTRFSFSFNRLGYPGATIAVRGANYTQISPYRVAVLSDIQEALYKVQDIYTKINTDTSLQFIISAGDLTSQGTEDEMRDFQKEMEKLNIPFYSTPGNHDAFDGFTPWQKYFGRGSFQFKFRGVHFTFADTGKASIEPATFDQLKNWLSNSAGSLSLFLAHIAPLEPSGIRDGAFASRAEAMKLLSLIAEKKVNLTLYGHVHSYYAYSNAGIPAYISGGGGAIPQEFDGIGRHFLAIDLNPADKNFAVQRIDVD